MNPKIEQVPFEKDLRKFSRELLEHKAKNNIEKIQESHVREVLNSRVGHVPVSGSAGAKAKTQVLNEADTLPDYLISAPAEVKGKVEELISLTFSQGLDKSTKAASKAGPFILDAFHDAITSKLYAELKKRNLLK